MQRVIQRALQYEKHVARKAEKLKASKDAYDYRVMQREIVQQRRAMRKMEKTARIEHREDWFLGPLAPRRDIGVLKSDLGVVPMEAVQSVEFAKKALKDVIKKANRGEPRNFFFEKDRAVIIRGPGKGTIGVITQVNWESQTAYLKNAIQADFNLPPWSETPQGTPSSDWDESKRHVLSTGSLQIRLEDLRMVIKHDGRDVIVDSMDIPREATEIDEENLTERPLQRFVRGTNIEIPTPTKQLEDSEKTYWSSDTFKDSVDLETYTPFMDQPPFPPSVIKELRKSFSKGNKRISPQYAEKLMHKEAREELRKKASRILMLDTPVKDAYRREMQAVREALPESHGKEPQWTGDSVDILAEFMSKHLSVGNTFPDPKSPESGEGRLSKQKKNDAKKDGVSKRWGVPKRTKLTWNDGWRARPGKMARRTEKVTANRTFEKLPLRVRRKLDKKKRYDLRPRR